jgi:hypothetical protein
MKKSSIVLIMSVTLAPLLGLLGLWVLLSHTAKNSQQETRPKLRQEGSGVF